MAQKGKPGLTDKLAEWKAGNEDAGNQALQDAYLELKNIARAYLARERSNHTLVATALVNEAYVRLLDQNTPYANRSHFFGLAATMMRRILLDYSKQRSREKRGGKEAVLVTLDEQLLAGDSHPVDVIDLDEALIELEALDPRQAKIIELKFFAGLTVEEIGEALEISERTIKREWRIARAWLHQRISRKKAPNT